MPRNMSFAMTTPQIINRTKTLTTRFGWWFLKPGEIVNAVEKAMGLKNGEKIKLLCPIQIVDANPEPLNAITQAQVIAEGFPHFTPDDFVNMIVKHYKCDPWERCNRIEFTYLA